jgi:NAD+ synthase (glutamine-hydrolysing)
MGKANLRIALAQINPTVGDLEGNSRKILLYINRAKESGADIISFPELALPGYPPEDLLLKPKFVEDNLEALKKLIRCVNNITAVIGFADKKGRCLYNAAAVIHNARIYGIYHKMLLPNYGVFDEKRYFEPGDKPLLFNLGKISFAVNICEDIWYESGPTKIQTKSGAKLILNINASPYYAGKIKERENILCKQAKTNRIVITYTNLIGGQDELVFDGQSMIVDTSGRIISRAKVFQEDLLIADLEIPETKKLKTATVIAEKFCPQEKPRLEKREPTVLDPVAEVYQALSLGLKDYVTKNGFKKVVIGLSGGIDSALVATLAADALGKENVTGLFMPTRHSSQESAAGAQALAENLGIKLSIISIEQIYNMYLVVLEPHFAGMQRDITEENIQARIRGNMLMAFSNKFGWLVLTTGNKSEMSTGYATLYGDMAGGLAVIKDVPKMLVYKLARYRNSLNPVIPEDTISRPPTAELRPNQKDVDSLPPYETLDPILKAYVEEDKELEKIVASGFDRETTARVLRMVDTSEYKRRQSPPGIKITPKAFGRDRRMPITNRYKG